MGLLSISPTLGFNSWENFAITNVCVTQLNFVKKIICSRIIQHSKSPQRRSFSGVSFLNQKGVSSQTNADSIEFSCIAYNNILFPYHPSVFSHYNDKKLLTNLLHPLYNNMNSSYTDSKTRFHLIAFQMTLRRLCTSEDNNATTTLLTD